MENRVKISNDEIFYFFNCKRLLYYSLNSDDGMFQTENALEPDRINMIKDFFSGEMLFDAGYDSKKTSEFVEAKKSVIRPSLTFSTERADVEVRPQALLWNGSEYVICIAHFSRNKNKRHLAISSIAYESMLRKGIEVSDRIYYIQRKRLTKGKIDDSLSRSLVEEITSIKDNMVPEPEGRRLCNVCSFWDECHMTQPNKKNLSLSTIRGIGSSMTDFFAQKNINTIGDLLDTPIDEEFKNEVKGIERMKLQAYAFFNDSAVFLNGDQKIIPDQQGKSCYLDIEAENYPYLFGFLEGREYLPIFFENEAGFEREFPKIFEYINSERFTIYHYCEYETKVLNSLAKKLKISLRNTEFLDVYMKLKQNVVLPLRHYSLKNVAKWLGFSWRVNLDGRSSIMEFKRWVKTGNKNHLNMILKYNEDDCRATEVVKKWLERPESFERKIERLEKYEIEKILYG